MKSFSPLSIKEKKRFLLLSFLLNFCIYYRLLWKTNTDKTICFDRSTATWIVCVESGLARDDSSMSYQERSVWVLYPRPIKEGPNQRWHQQITTQIRIFPLKFSMKVLTKFNSKFQKFRAEISKFRTEIPNLDSEIWKFNTWLFRIRDSSFDIFRFRFTILPHQSGKSKTNRE